MDWKPEARGTCGDCGIREGEFHLPGCDMEICPFCGGQLLSCECCYTQLEVDCSEGTWAYENGLTRAQSERWDRLLEAQGRIRFVRPVILCARCGRCWPSLFMESDWDKVVPEPYRREVLCRRCYETVRAFVLEAMEGGH